MDDYSNCIEVTVTCVEEKGNERLIGRARLFYLDLAAVFDTNDSVHNLFDIRPETAPSIQHSLIKKQEISNPTWREFLVSTFAS
jgi:hypothetical protein